MWHNIAASQTLWEPKQTDRRDSHVAGPNAHAIGRLCIVSNRQGRGRQSPITLSISEANLNMAYWRQAAAEILWFWFVFVVPPAELDHELHISALPLSTPSRRVTPLPYLNVWRWRWYYVLRSECNRVVFTTVPLYRSVTTTSLMKRLLAYWFLHKLWNSHQVDTMVRYLFCVVLM